MDAKFFKGKKIMKALLIANSSTVFGRETFQKLNEEGLEVEMLDFATLKHFKNNEIINDEYSQKLKKFIRYPKISMFARIYYIGRFISNNSFKTINIHLVATYYILIISLLSKHRLILTVYGSDFYRMNRFKRWLQKFLFQKAQTITFTNPSTQKSFLEYYKCFEDKTNVCRFGLGTLDFIDKNRKKNRYEIKTILGYSLAKIIITCGYNSTKEQQHLEIIKNITSIDEDTLNKIQFIFPMTYGDKIYKKNIKKILEQTNLDYLVLEDFLYEDYNAYIKLASDIMINILETDSFSGSMQEFLYANNLVITGDWLPYDLFDNSGVFYYKIGNTNQLKNKLIEVLSSFDFQNENSRLSDEKITIKNIPIIYSLSSWKNNIKNWVEVYNKKGLE